MKTTIIFSKGILAKKIASRLNELNVESKNRIKNEYFEKVLELKLEHDNDIYIIISSFFREKFDKYIIPFQALIIEDSKLEDMIIPDRICLLFQELYDEISERMNRIIALKINDDKRYFDDETYEILNKITYESNSVYDTPLPTIVNLYIYYAEDEKVEINLAMQKALSDLYIFYFNTSIMDFTDISLKYLNQILKIKYPNKECIQNCDFTKIKKIYSDIEKGFIA